MPAPEELSFTGDKEEKMWTLWDQESSFAWSLRIVGKQ